MSLRSFLFCDDYSTEAIRKVSLNFTCFVLKRALTTSKQKIGQPQKHVNLRLVGSELVAKSGEIQGIGGFPLEFDVFY